MTDQTKQRIADLLLAEIKTHEPQWFLIANVNKQGKYVSGAFIFGYGPTDCWRIFHTLQLYQKDCSTETMQIPVGGMKKVAEEMRWRLLSEQEINAL